MTDPLKAPWPPYAIVDDSEPVGAPPPGHDGWTFSLRDTHPGGCRGCRRAIESAIRAAYERGETSGEWEEITPTLGGGQMRHVAGVRLIHSAARERSTPEVVDGLNQRLAAVRDEREPEPAAVARPGHHAPYNALYRALADLRAADLDYLLSVLADGAVRRERKRPATEVDEHVETLVAEEIHRRAGSR